MTRLGRKVRLIDNCSDDGLFGIAASYIANMIMSLVTLFQLRANAFQSRARARAKNFVEMSKYQVRHASSL
jgi:hypothetical protein